jgi:L-2-hydroxyglutarate oxidase LhgO
MKIYDYIIVGAGIAGLYTGYKLNKLNNNFLILEKSDYYGGRIKVEEFGGIKVNMGAGVFMEEHKILINILKELNLKYNSFKSVTKYVWEKDENKIEEIKNKVITAIKNSYDSKIENISFFDFMNIYLDNEIRDLIERYNYFCDFWNLNIHSFMKDYIKELFPEKEHIYCSVNGGWNMLLDNLVKEFKDNIKLNEEVVKIMKNKDIFDIITNNKNIYYAKKVILCGDASLKKVELLGVDEFYKNFLNKIKNECCLRIYAKHQKIEKLNYGLRTNNMMYKLIPITDEITMISYVDGEQAKKLKNLLDKSKNVKKVLEKMVKNAYDIELNIEKIKYRCFPYGNHYLDPYIDVNGCYKYYYNNIKKLFEQNSIILVGDYVNNGYGWLEYALQSVDYLLD